MLEANGEAPTSPQDSHGALEPKGSGALGWYIKAQAVYVGTRNERQHRDADVYQAKITANTGGLGARAERVG